jgi:hypothetical protein
MGGNIFEYRLHDADCRFQRLFIRLCGETACFLRVSVRRGKDREENNRREPKFKSVGIRKQALEQVNSMRIFALGLYSFGAEKGEENFLRCLLSVIGIIPILYRGERLCGFNFLTR